MRTSFAVMSLVGTLCVSHSTSTAEPCAPAAVVDGDRDIAEPVQRELRSLGVSARAGQSCPIARAEVTRVGMHLGITVRGVDGRTHQRTVSTAGVAATWIESWVRDDIGAPLLAARALPAVPAVVEAPPPRVARSAQPPVVAPVNTLASEVRAMVSTATAADESSWRTLSVGGCVLVSWLCVGVEGTFVSNSELVTDERPMPVDRSGIDLAFTLSAPVRVGRGTLSPQVGAGVGWLTTKRGPLVLDPAGNPGCADGTQPPEPDPTDPNAPPPCEPGDPIDDGLRAPTTSLRTHARLRYALPLSDAAALELGVGIQWLPGAHREPFRFGAPGPDGTIDDNIEPDAPVDPFMSLPGEPSWMWSAGIGVRVDLR